MIKINIYRREMIAMQEDSFQYKCQIQGTLIISTKLNIILALKAIFQFSHILTKHSISDCFKVISSCLILWKQRNMLCYAPIWFKKKTASTDISICAIIIYVPTTLICQSSQYSKHVFVAKYEIRQLFSLCN